jgi:GntR family transcriptional regulator
MNWPHVNGSTVNRILTKKITRGRANVPARQPLYAQVKALILRHLIDGVWRPGTMLPSEIQLGVEFGVSQGTVRKALDALTAENLVVRRQGRGTFVAEHDTDRALFHFFHMVAENTERELPDSNVLSCRYGKATSTEASRLALLKGDPVARIRRVRALGGVPAIVETIVLSEALFPGIGRDGDLPNTLYELYERRYEVTVARAEERLTAKSAEPIVAELLGIAESTPLLEIDRTAFSLDGGPVEWRLSLCETTTHYYLAELV